MTKPAATNRPIYLDHHATTPTDPRVLEVMLPYFCEHFGNPHSIQHVIGRTAAAAVEAAREQVAALIGADPREIVFTSGATESNNVAIKGAAWFAREHQGKDHIVTAVSEHKCVLESCRRLERQGFRVTYLPVDRHCQVDLDALADAIEDKTILISLMAAQNEVGSLAPIEAIGALTRERGVLFHTDAAQATGKMPLDVNAANIDLMSISGHKIYGPKGVGVLYVRRRPRARLEPLFDGGGQERGFRSGTVAPALVVGLGEACAVAQAGMAEENERLLALRTRLAERIEGALPDAIVNGDPEQRLAGNFNVSFPKTDGTALIEALAEDVCVSSGSACTSASVESSYVLRAMGLSDALAGSSLRIGLGRSTTEHQIDAAADRIVAEVQRLRGAEANDGSGGTAE
ncbi:MAG: aminotransferase class V-fold PLP-dependent enzyme [Alphaproteobacteria bacterium]|nr:aminotransferase class V-fold PLP-dependent enzyme [Alphaproteobacteria bacterium]